MEEKTKIIIEKYLENLVKPNILTLPEDKIPSDAINIEFIRETSKGNKIYKVIVRQKITISYEMLISSIMRLLYKTLDEEIALINNQHTHPEEYAEYQETRTYIEARAKEVLGHEESEGALKNEQ